MENYRSFDWKKWGLYVGVPLLVVIIVILIIFFLSGKKDNPGDVNQNPKDQQIPSGYQGNGMPRPGSDQTQSPAPSEPPTPSDLPQASFTGKPATAFGGKILSYKEMGNRAELEVAIAGNAENKRVFHMNVGSLVFDTKTNVLLTPSALENANADTSRFLVTGSESEDWSVEAVILNDTPNLIYSVVSDVTKTDKGVLLVDNVRSYQYTLTSDSKVINALTGDPFDLSKVKFTDRVFVYPAEGYESAFEVSDSASAVDIPVDSMYIYPTKR